MTKAAVQGEDGDQKAVLSSAPEVRATWRYGVAGSSCRPPQASLM
jgi:hypothetical protein